MSSIADWGLPAVLLVAATTVWIWPERSFAVLLALVALAASPLAPALMGSSVPGVGSLLSSVKRLLVDFLAEVLDPALRRSLPNALVSTFGSKDLPPAMGSMVSGLLTEKGFQDVLREFVKGAMDDKEIVDAVTAVIRKALEDSSLYESAAHGVAGTLKHHLNPFHRREHGQEGDEHDTARQTES